MSVRHWRRILRRLAAQDGVSLIELLVVIAAGTVVMSGLFTMIEVTLRQTTRTFNRVDATQRARKTLEGMMNELHSACIAPSATPIQPQSSATRILFESQYSNAATVTPVTEHEITYDSVAHTLTEQTYVATGGTSPNWTFSATPTKPQPTTLLTNVRTAQFAYYAYQQVSFTDAAGNPYVMLLDGTQAVPGTTTIPAAAPLALPLSVANAPKAAEVTIDFTVGPAGGGSETTAASPSDATVSDSVILRLSPAANHAGGGATFIPCQ
jgi:prepilin-type N-terminal cleavage/methylation domain-containing protein